MLLLWYDQLTSPINDESPSSYLFVVRLKFLDGSVVGAII